MYTETQLLTGTVVSNYYFCRRHSWLAYHKIIPDKNIDRFIEWKVIHEQFLKGLELKLGDVSIDGIKKDVLFEIKSTKSNITGTKGQIKYYLYLLNEVYGLSIRKAILQVKNYKTYEIFYTPEVKEEIELLIGEIRETVNWRIPTYESCKGSKCNQCFLKEQCSI